MNAALMHAATKLLQEPPNPEGNAGYTPVAANNSAEDAPAAHSVERTPAASARAWHYSAMSAATCALSALLGYIATEAIFKRIRGRN
jgi:hypothetical protein